MKKTKFHEDNKHEDDLIMSGFSFFDLEMSFENEDIHRHKGKSKEQVLEYCFKNLLRENRQRAIENFELYKDYFFRDEPVTDEEVKTLQGWKNSNSKTFNDYFPIGCKVDEDIVREMLEALPPRTNAYGLMQMGEPVGSGYDTVTGKYRTTWMTFYKKEEQWYYAGNCFAGETLNRD